MKLTVLYAVVGLVSLASAQVDHRHSQSSVKNQGGRGTCVAFSICAALETFPGVPTNISEQLLYATVKLHENAVDRWKRKLGMQPGISEGNKFEDYVRLFEMVGTAHETYLPYDPNPKKAGPGVPVEIRRYLELAQAGERDLQRMRDAFGKYGFRAKDCTLLMPTAARDVDRLKRELDAGRLAIPVSYAVYGPKWASADDDPKRTRTMIHPGLMWKYRFVGEQQWLGYGAAKLLCGGKRPGFVEAVRTGVLERQKFPDPKGELYGGHAVTIVGYDQHGFQVKNSWGAWGDDGYCTVAFDYHALLASRALLIDDVYIRTPKLGPFDRSVTVEKARFRLKAQRDGVGAKARLVLSTWSLEPRDPNVEVVEYLLEGQGKDGKWQQLVRKVVRARDTESRRGLPLVVDGGAWLRALGNRQLRVTVRYGKAQPIDPRKPDAATFVRTVPFAAFSPDLPRAVDLSPR